MEDIKETNEEILVDNVETSTENEVTEEQSYVCEKCGKVYNELQKFCSVCGHEIGTNVSKDRKNICKKCGKEFSEGEKFCSACGEKLETKKNIIFKRMFNKKYVKYYAISGILIVILVITSIVIISNNKKRHEAELAKIEEEKNKIDLAKIYEKYCSSEWAYLSSDGSSLTIDTNPSNASYNKVAKEATYGFVNVNNALGLPDSVLEKMKHTRALDGIQTETFEGLEVSWSYHPENGMEIIYETY